MKTFPRRWLVIDTNFLAYRAWHTTGGLKSGEEPTGVIYGILKTVQGLCEWHGTTRCIFCFDHGPGLRHGMYPEYKANRERDDDFENFKSQLDKLRDVYLPEAGFANVFHHRGYEADDLIALVCQTQPRGVGCIIVSTDKDLYQCLRPNVWMWNPIKGKSYTKDDYIEEFGLNVGQWPDVKAIAGCSSDNIAGVPGVGEKTAIKFLRGELPTHHKTYEKITTIGGGIWQTNLPLVTLPLPGLPDKFNTPTPAPIKTEQWNAVAERLGMHSLIRTAPRGKIRSNLGLQN